MPANTATSSLLRRRPHLIAQVQPIFPSFQSLPYNNGYYPLHACFYRVRASIFPKNLTEEVFLQRLQHSWSTDLVEVNASKGVARAIWIPAEVYFYTNRYELHWQLRGVEYIPETTIPPGFLDREGLFGEEMVSIETGGAGHPTDGIIIGEMGTLDSEAIPLSSRFTREELAQRAKERKKIRQARLRVALAQLKAERLAERYFRKYGDFEEVDDSGSELSDWEEKSFSLRDALAEEEEGEAE
jgi:hypothetical protein